MEGKLKFVVHGRKEGNKFVLEEITNYIMKNLESFNDKTIIVTFEMPITTNEINMNNCIQSIDKAIIFRNISGMSIR
jgi:hypothetical protein